jgi:hypothetical protein
MLFRQGSGFGSSFFTVTTFIMVPSTAVGSTAVGSTPVGFMAVGFMAVGSTPVGFMAVGFMAAATAKWGHCKGGLLGPEPVAGLTLGDDRLAGQIGLRVEGVIDRDQIIEARLDERAAPRAKTQAGSSALLRIETATQRTARRGRVSATIGEPSATHRSGICPASGMRRHRCSGAVVNRKLVPV